MKENELRIGNMLIRDDYEMRVYHIERSGKYFKVNDVVIDFEDKAQVDKLCAPAPITEERLKKLGLEDKSMMFANEPMRRWRKDELILEWDINGWFCYLENGTEQSITIRLDSIHQIQNLNFALTGQELEAK